MNVTIIPIRIEVRTAYAKGGTAYAKGGTPLNIQAIVNVKISTDEALVGNAIERFLGCDRSELARVAQETLDGISKWQKRSPTPTPKPLKLPNLAKPKPTESDCCLNLGPHQDQMPAPRNLCSAKTRTAAPDAFQEYSNDRGQVCHGN